MNYITLILLLVAISCNNENSAQDVPIANPESSYRLIENSEFDKAGQYIIALYVEFENPDGKVTQGAASGLIINDSYVCAAYHSVKKFSLKLKKIVGYYNLKNGAIPDTVTFDLNYKYSKSQYDFTKHKYDTLDPSTDILILKTIRKIRYTPLKYVSHAPRFQDTIFSVGFNKNPSKPIFDFEAAYSKVVSYYVNPVNPKAVYTVTLGGIVPGFSGGPIVNSSSEVLGLTLYGQDKFDEKYLRELLKNGYLEQEQYSDIERGYKVFGQKLSYALDIFFIKEKYFKGFIGQ